MCQFKSGVILKNKIVIAPGENDSHSDLLESLGIEDDYLGASKKFVRAELIPENDEWWVSPEEHPDKWVFIVDQDITPDWFDKEEHEKLFREAVCDWWKEHVLVDQKIDELSSGFYRLKRCEIKKLCNDVKVLLYGSQVGEMWGSSQVGTMWGSSQVGTMWESSQVGTMRGKLSGRHDAGKLSGRRDVGKLSGRRDVGKLSGRHDVGKLSGRHDVGKLSGRRDAGKLSGRRDAGKLYRERF